MSLIVNSDATPVSEGRQKRKWPQRPFKGLDPYLASDTQLFSQRVSDVETCAALLDDFSTKILMPHGLSGTGKSSFLRAGLLPRLEHAPQGGARFFFLRDPDGAALVVRATSDPIGHMHAAFREAVQRDLRFSARVRSAFADRIGAAPDPDREVAAEVLLFGLEILSGEAPGIFAIAVDQTEEVLTSTHQDEQGSNRRRAFFWFLEELCHLGHARSGRERRQTPRAIISFRTEFYGQFTSFFSQDPDDGLRSEALPPSGKRSYLLQPIGEAKQLAEIIRLPTSKEAKDARGAPYGEYRFEFDPALPEIIAQDILKLTGDTSALPVLQLVCLRLYERMRIRKEVVIRLSDYDQVGHAEGALDDHIAEAIDAAIKFLGGPTKSRKYKDVRDRWRSFLCHFIGQREVGALASLLLSEEQLTPKAGEEQLDASSTISAMEFMARQSSPLVRVVQAAGSLKRFFTLGHDCLAKPLVKWKDANGIRLYYNKQARRRVLFWRNVYGGLLLGSIGLLVAYLLLSNHELKATSVDALTVAAESTPELRLRLLMLVAASRMENETPTLKYWPARRNENIDADLRDTLLRAPVFVGDKSAAVLDSGSGRLTFLKIDKRNVSNGSLETLDLPLDTGAIDPLTLVSFGQSHAVTLQGLVNREGELTLPPILGLVDAPRDGAFSSKDKVIVLSPPLASDAAGFGSGNWAKALSYVGADFSGLGVDIENGQALDEAFARAAFPASVDFGARGARLQIINWKGGSAAAVSFVPIAFNFDARGHLAMSPRAGSSSSDWDVNWKPREQFSPRLPVLAPDCDKYAFVGTGPRPGPEGTDASPKTSDPEPRMFLGDVSGADASWRNQQPSFALSPDLDLRAAISVAYGRGCGLVSWRYSTRQKPGSPFALNEVLAVATPTGANWNEARQKQYTIPEDTRGFVAQTTPSTSPVLVASAERADRGIRAAWLTPNQGLAVVEAGSGPVAANLLDSGDNIYHPEKEDKHVFLTGIDASVGNSKMWISNSGDFLLFQHQKSFAEIPQVRLFDFHVKERRQMLADRDPKELQDLACRIAASLPEGDQLSGQERISLLREIAMQPCAHNGKAAP